MATKRTLSKGLIDHHSLKRTNSRHFIQGHHATGEDDASILLNPTGQVRLHVENRYSKPSRNEKWANLNPAKPEPDYKSLTVKNFGGWFRLGTPCIFFFQSVWKPEKANLEYILYSVRLGVFARA